MMTPALVRAILEKAHAFEWSVQGFGFLRTKIANVGRIHIWDSRLRVQLVSDVHEHPWPLKSTIISGELINQRFKSAGVLENGLPYVHSRLATGEGGHLIGEPAEISLVSLAPELYCPGDTYRQEANEIHRSIPVDGTVTLMERPLGPPLQETSVYWPRGAVWGSAEPRLATDWERNQVISYALARWFVR